MDFGGSCISKIWIFILQVASIGLDYRKVLKTRPTIALEQGEFQNEGESKVNEVESKPDETERDSYDSRLRSCHQRSADKLLKLCCDNGGCFIKVGNFVSRLGLFSLLT